MQTTAAPWRAHDAAYINALILIGLRTALEEPSLNLYTARNLILGCSVNTSDSSADADSWKRNIPDSAEFASLATTGLTMVLPKKSSATTSDFPIVCSTCPFLLISW